MHPGAADRAVSIWWLRSNDQSELKYATACAHDLGGMKIEPIIRC